MSAIRMFSAKRKATKTAMGESYAAHIGCLLISGGGLRQAGVIGIPEVGCVSGDTNAWWCEVCRWGRRGSAVV